MHSYPLILGIPSLGRIARQVVVGGGGILIIVKNCIITSEQKQYKIDCEVLWVKSEFAGVKHLYRDAYSRPKESDVNNAEESKKVSRLNEPAER